RVNYSMCACANSTQTSATARWCAAPPRKAMPCHLAGGSLGWAQRSFPRDRRSRQSLSDLNPDAFRRNAMDHGAAASTAPGFVIPEASGIVEIDFAASSLLWNKAFNHGVYDAGAALALSRH